LAFEGLGEGGDGVEVGFDDLDARGEGGGGRVADEGREGEFARVNEGIQDWLSDKAGALIWALESYDKSGSVHDCLPRQLRRS
jgi:hypothetical protein